MSEATPRLGLPLLAAGQAHKEALHNEALTLLEALAVGLAEEAPRDDPPGAPAPGQLWIVGAAPTGAWSGQAGAMALWTEGGWRFLPAAEGVALRLKTSGLPIARHAGGWSAGEVVATGLLVGGDRVVGGRGGAIAGPAGGTVIDAEARAAIAAILVALRTHGLIAI